MSFTAADLDRSVGRLLSAMGYAVLSEATLGNGRRADLLGVDAAGALAIVEIKVSIADLRGDAKWPDYLDYCDRFWFAIPPSLDAAVLEAAAFQPQRVGLIRADRFEAVELRAPVSAPLAPARRKAETLRFARRAAERLRNQRDDASSALRPASVSML